MRNLTSLAVAGIAAAALLAPIGSAHAAIVRGGSPAQFSRVAQPRSLGRVYMPTISAHRAIPATCCNMNYGNGPVLTTPHMYLIFWGYSNGDPDNMQALLTSWGAHYGGSGYGRIATQYYQIVGGVKTWVTDPKNASSVWVDNTNPIPAHPTDAQVQAEAWAAVAHFGNADPNGAYIVNSAYNHDPQGFLTSGWCAYHGASSSGGKIISYTNEPYMPDAGSDCGASFITPPSDETSADEGATIVIGHEYNESVSDPQPPSGWYSNQAGEDGDACAWTDIQNDKFGTARFTSQPIYSDLKDNCVHSIPKQHHK